jgi:hypothetical protein
MRGKIILSVFIALIVCFGLGFGWGRSGRAGLDASLEATRQQLDVAEARGHLLDARVSLYSINFGDASRHLEEAKPTLRRVRDRYQTARQTDAAARIDAALGLVDEAQRMAGKLDQAANSKTGEALEAVRAAASNR